MDRLVEVIRASSQLGAVEISLRLVFIAVLAGAVSLVYALHYRGFGRPSQLGLVLVLVAMAVGGIIMAIGENLALSLGMVGALSIVRFRAAVKDNRDLAYLFWAVALGLVVGAGNYLLGLLLLGIVGLAVVLLERVRPWERAGKRHVVILSARRDEAGAAPVRALLPAGALLRSSVFHRESATEEATFLVDFHDQAAIDAFSARAAAEPRLSSWQVLGPDDALFG